MESQPSDNSEMADHSAYRCVNHTPLPGVLGTNLQDKYLEAIEWAPEQEVAWEDGVGEAGQRVTLQVRQQRRVHCLHPIIKLDQ